MLSAHHWQCPWFLTLPRPGLDQVQAALCLPAGLSPALVRLRWGRMEEQEFMRSNREEFAPEAQLSAAHISLMFIALPHQGQCHRTRTQDPSRQPGSPRLEVGALVQDGLWGFRVSECPSVMLRTSPRLPAPPARLLRSRFVWDGDKDIITGQEGPPTHEPSPGPTSQSKRMPFASSELCGNPATRRLPPRPAARCRRG